MISKKAFTLLEIIIVISIIGTASLLSVSSMMRYSAAVSLNSAAAQIQSVLSLIRQYAVSSGAMHELFCEGNHYAIRKQNIATGVFEEIKSAVLPNNTSFTNHISIRFASSGFPVPGYFGSITLRNKHKKTKKIIVSSVGRIRIE